MSFAQRFIIFVVFLLGFEAALLGQAVTLNLNSLPTAQGWTFRNSCPRPEASLFSVAGNLLHQNTIGCGESGSYYTFDNVVTGKSFTLTVRARVTADEVVLCNPPLCNSVASAHLGFSFGVEGGGQEYYIGLGPGFVDSYVAPGMTVVLSTSVDTTQFHTYTLKGNPADGSFTLAVDGVQIGSGHAAPPNPPNANDVFVGDGTSGANAVGDYSALSFQSCQAAPGQGSGPCLTSPLDGATPQSQFVALSGTGTPGDDLQVLANGLPVGSVTVDSEGNWEALPYISPFGNSVAIQVQDIATFDSSNAITVHPLTKVVDAHGNPILGPCCTSFTRLLPLRKADVFVSANPSSPQVRLYGATYTHTALYLGGDADGTPWIAEAVEHNEAEADVFGQVRSVPLEHSFIWNGSTIMAAFRPTVELSGATRSLITGWAEDITKQGLPYWSNADFGLILLADGLFNASVGRLAQRFNAALNAIDALKNSISTFICSTLVWRSYYEGTNHTLDISNPNLMSAQPGSLLANFSPAFIDQLDSVFLVPETFVRSPKLSHQIF